ncbi:MAG: glucose 1-dehydrogenase [Chloroflexota bacterium]
MIKSYHNKVALVTGGGSGIGRATAVMFAREGAKVVVADQNVAGCEETVQLVRAMGGEATPVKVDVREATEVEAMVQIAVDTYGRLDCAFNSAGIAAVAIDHVAECDEDDWMRVIDINLKGVFLSMKYELQQMTKQGSGAIVNVASIYGLVAEGNKTYGVSAYAASKHGVVGLTKAAALEYAKSGIRINTVCPGHTETPLIQGILDNPEKLEWMTSRYPMGRLGKPAEIAEAVVWLCSDAASFVTGHMMSVDGGYVTQ